MAQLYTSNFDAFADGQMPTGWQLFGSYAGASAANAASGANSFYLNGEATVLYTALAAQTVQRVQITATGPGPDTAIVIRSDATLQNAYRWRLINGFGTSHNVEFQKQVAGGGWVPITSFEGIGTSGASGAIMEAISTGSTHEFRVWAPGGTRPASTIATFTDASFASGVFGASNTSTSGRNFDDAFYYSDIGVAAPTAPGAPTMGTATAGLGQASITFTAPASNGGAAITSYLVTASTGQTATGTASPITVTGLSSVPTTFTVQAINSVGAGAASAASNSVTPTADTVAPTLVSAVTNADGTAVVLTFSESLGSSTPGSGAFTMTSRTIGSVAVSGAAVTLGSLSSAILITDVIEVSYVKPGANMLKDAANNQVASFGPVSVTNAVAPYEWTFLGNENSSATVPANTTVRYGVTGSYTTKVLSGTFVINNSTFPDPAPGVSKHADAFLPVPTATRFIVNMESAGRIGTSAPFTVTVDGTLPVAKTLTISAPGMTVTPSTITLGPNQSGLASATFTLTSTEPTTATVHFTTTSDLAVPADKSYRADFAIIRTVANKTEFQAFADYVRGMDLVSLGVSVVAELTASMRADGISLLPSNSNEDCHVIVRPAAGFEIAASGAVNFGGAGITLTAGYSDAFNVNQGVEVAGVNIDLIDDASSAGRNYYGALDCAAGGYGQGGAYRPTFTRCNVRAANANKSFRFGGYGVQVVMRSCLVIQEGPDRQLFDDRVVLQNCGLVRRNGTFTQPMFSNAGLVEMENCYGIGLGSQLSADINADWSFFASNVLDTAVTTGKVRGIQDLAPIGFVAATGFVVNDANDYTPAAAGPLIGTASIRAKSTNDLRGNNRGLTPDIGPIQRTPATPLTVARVTAIAGPDGQSMTWSGTTTNTPTSAMISLVPGNPDNGAIRQGPYPITLGTNTFTVALDDIEPGNYVPTLSFTNAGGTSVASGSGTFEIVGVSSLVFDSGAAGAGGGGTVPQADAPTITITTADTAIMSGKRATVSGAVNLQGDATGHVDLFLDPQPSGTPVALGAANVSSGTWTKQTDLAPGLYQLRVVATANGQSVTASTGNIRVLNLVGNFNLPMA